MIALSNLYTVPLSTNLPFNWRDTTPVPWSRSTSSSCG